MILSGIYKITNLTNGKIYIGQSRDILARWQEHISKANYQNVSYNYPLYQDFRNLGLTNFSFEFLELNIYDKEQLDKLEKEYISKFNSFNNGYNQTRGNKTEEEKLNTSKKLWTDEEINLMTTLIQQGLSQKEVAIRLNRSVNSINSKANKLKIGKRVNHPWTKELEQQMLQLRNEHYTQSQVGEILGFSKEAVKKRWHDKFTEKEGAWK